MWKFSTDHRWNHFDMEKLHSGGFYPIPHLCLSVTYNPHWCWSCPESVSSVLTAQLHVAAYLLTRPQKMKSLDWISPSPRVLLLLPPSLPAPTPYRTLFRQTLWVLLAAPCPLPPSHIRVLPPWEEEAWGGTGFDLPLLHSFPWDVFPIPHPRQYDSAQTQAGRYTIKRL